MYLYSITLNSKCRNDYVGNDFDNPTTVRADSVSVGTDHWVKFYTVDDKLTMDKSRTSLVYTISDEYVAAVRNLGVAPPESAPPPNAAALESQEFDLKNEPPVGTVLRLSFPTGYFVGTATGRRRETYTDMILVRIGDGWMSGTDGHIFLWEPKIGGTTGVYLMLQEAARVQVAEFRTVSLADRSGH